MKWNKTEHKLDPFEKRMQLLGVDVETRSLWDEDECYWRGTLLDRCETKIHNQSVRIRELEEDVRELKDDLFEANMEIERLKKHGK